MKKLLITLNLFCSFISLGQNSIQELTEPTKSRGYISWMPVTNANNYQINFYDLSNSNSNILSLSTNYNYINLDPLILHLPNVYYVISALDNSSQIIYSSNPNYNVVNPEGDPVYDVQCEKVCNGKTYAYKMTGQKKELDDNINPLGPMQILAQEAYAFQDEVTGVYVPLYQAMSQTVFDGLSQYHPYKQYYPYNYTGYTYVTLPTGHPGVYYDAAGDPVDKGLLISKKMDQFSYFDGKLTTESADAGYEICGNNLSGAGNSWINFFNTYVQDVTYPTTSTAFSPFIMHNLQCVGAWEHTDENGNIEWGSGGEWTDWITELIQDFAKDHHNLNNGNNTGSTINWATLSSYFGDLALSQSASGDHVGALIFTNITFPDKVAILNKNEDNVFIPELNSPDLPIGLYVVTALTDNGNVLPYYMDINFQVSRPSLSDFTEVLVTPNPIENGILRYSITSSYSSSFNYLIHDSYGNEIIAGQDSFDQTGNFEIDLNNFQFTNNYIILSIIFPDGTIIQQNAQFN